MDYGFAPGLDRDKHGKWTYEWLDRRLLENREDAELIHRKGLTIFQQFINELKTGEKIVRPIGNILLGTHANEGGLLKVPMFPGQVGATRYEALEETLEATDPEPNPRSISIPNNLIEHTSSNPFFHIKGCNIGKARPFLEKLREALGNNMTVTAPKHFHQISWIGDLGVFEAMEYEYLVVSPKKLTNPVVAFQSKTFPPRMDGSKAEENWSYWIAKKRLQKVRVPLGPSIGNRTTIEFKAGLDLRHNKYGPYAIEYDNKSAVPTSEPKQKAALEKTLNEDPTFDVDNHPFPVFKRWSYGSVSEFVKGFSWEFKRLFDERKKKWVLRCTGFRFEYTILLPIVDRAGNAIFNFHPNKVSTLKAITTGLVESNGFFFESVP